MAAQAPPLQGSNDRYPWRGDACVAMVQNHLQTTVCF